MAPEFCRLRLCKQTVAAEDDEANRGELDTNDWRHKGSHRGERSEDTYSHTGEEKEVSDGSREGFGRKRYSPRVCCRCRAIRRLPAFRHMHSHDDHSAVSAPPLLCTALACQLCHTASLIQHPSLHSSRLFTTTSRPIKELIHRQRASSSTSSSSSQSLGRTRPSRTEIREPESESLSQLH